jgi:hypothetical protein
MTSVLQWLEAMSPLLTAVFVFLGPLALGAVYWQLQKHFKPRDEIEETDSKIEKKLDALIDKVDGISAGNRDLSARMDVIERLEQGEPSRHELARDNAALKADTAALKSSVEGIDRRISGMDSYLRDFIDREGRKS